MLSSPAPRPAADNLSGMSAEERRPIGAVLPGSGLHPLDPGWTPLQAFVLVKALDEAGDTVWSSRTSERFNLEELLCRSRGDAERGPLSAGSRTG